MYALGIDLGGTNIKAALVHQQDGISELKSIPTQAAEGLEPTLQRITELINSFNLEEIKPIAGVGIGAPGMISFDRKTVKNPPNLPGWKEVHLADEIQTRTGLPTILENDANLMALGSSRFGAGYGHNHFIMITLGTGVGGGIIYNNSIFRGANGAAGELGHITIDFAGAQCNSTVTGAIEGYLGQRFLSRRAADVIRKHPDNRLYELFKDDWSKLEPMHLTEEADNGNILAADILKDAGEKLGYALVNYIHTLDITTIIVSGGVSKAGKWLLDPAKKVALEQLMPPFRPRFKIISEQLGNEAALLGAAALAFENL